MVITDEIIAEAKRKYPIGTIVNSLGGSGHNTIRHHDFFMVDNSRMLRATDECLLLNSSGTWAAIVKKATKKSYSIW
jgi:hypothetical protein